MWSSLIPVFASAATLLFVPGGLVGIAAGLRKSLAIGLAPAISVGLIAGTGVIAPMLAVPWGLLTVSAVTLFTVIVILAVRLVLARRHPERRRTSASRWPQLGTLVTWCLAWPLSAAVTGLTVCRIINTPNAISQTFDAVFHLNAVEWILQTDNASSLRFYLEAPEGFVYPVGWHTLVALSMKLCHATAVPVATNATVLAVAALVWTSGCLTLTHVIFRGHYLALFTAAVIAGSLSAFPSVMLSWGVLYPNFFAISLLPSVLAATHQLLTAADTQRTPLLLPVAILAIGGLGLSQPNTVVTLVIASVVLSVTTVLGTSQDKGAAARIRRQAYVANALIIVMAVTWIFLRPPFESAIWGPSYATSGSIGEVVTTMPVQLPVVWTASVLTFIGFVAALRTRPYRWLAVLHITTSILYVVARSTKDEEIRYIFVGTWYKDASRLAALIPVTAVPLAALGMIVLARWAQKAVAGRLTVPQWLVRSSYPVIVLALVLTGPLSETMSDTVKLVEKSYLMSADSSSLTPDEYALIERLPDLIEKDAVVAVDPGTGASLAYAISGVDTNLKHLLHRHNTDIDRVDYRLNKASTDPAVCPALRRMRITYVLYFPGKIISDKKPVPGFAHLDNAPGFELVSRQGKASLYRITACG